MGTDAKSLVRESVELHRRTLEAELKLATKRVEALERKHAMISDQFEERFAAGSLGDDREWFDWKAELTIVLGLRQKLDAMKGLP